MRFTVLFTSLAFLLPSVLPSPAPRSFALWAANSAIVRGQGNGLDASGKPLVSYEHGELQWALRLLFERTGNHTFFNYIKQGVDNVVASNGSVGGGYSAVQFQLDPLRVGPSFIYLYEKTREKKYKQAADLFRAQFAIHSRTAQGQFWHKLIYPNEGWLDGVYMGDVFYATYTKAFEPNNQTAWDDITLQFKLMFENTIQKTATPNHTFSGLLYHGYDFAHKQVWADPDRGHSPEIWDRALGWFMMALVDTLELIDSPPRSRKTEALHALLLSMLNTLAPRLAAITSDATPSWWLVITQPGRAGNYFESSGASMYVYALSKAVRLGYVHDRHGEIIHAAKRAYKYITQHFVVDNGDGTMNWEGTVRVGSLDTDGSFEYYTGIPTVVNDLKGLAAFILASIEFEAL
ncbi:Six-hairpin glycosidase [Cristinia sonorae]|uniref:Six-hairpin glycosidase n=1 Tax=Cristinia sonorae TaxID=1940300 RepID=A0A8K0USM5_9AGAR|nr:Six-hairpin glycosidase [Cristinia sonorae]